MIGSNFYRSLSDKEIAKGANKIKVWEVVLYVGLVCLLLSAQWLVTKLKYG
jgi:hypothetical protein